MTMRARSVFFRVFTLFLGVSVALLMAACGEAEGRAPVLGPVPQGDPAQGRAAIQQYGCGTCHVIPGVPGANGHVGPPLTQFAERQYIAGAMLNTPANLIAWIMDPDSIEPGTYMPDVGLTRQDARDIAAYLSTLR